MQDQLVGSLQTRMKQIILALPSLLLAALVSNWVTMILSHQRRVQESVVLSVSKHVF